MILNLDLLMLVFKYLPKDKYSSNPGLKSSTQGPSMPQIGYSDRFEKYSAAVVSHFQQLLVINKKSIIGETLPLHT